MPLPKWFMPLGQKWQRTQVGKKTFLAANEVRMMVLILFILFPMCSHHVLKFPIDSPTSSQ